MRTILALIAVALTSCETFPNEKAVCKVGVTINGKSYKLTDGSTISYREPNGRFAALKVEIPQ